MKYTFLVVRPAKNNAHETLKIFGVDSIITNIPIDAFWATKKLGKSYFMLISRKVFTMEKVVGKLIDQGISVGDVRGREYY